MGRCLTQPEIPCTGLSRRGARASLLPSALPAAGRRGVRAGCSLAERAGGCGGAAGLVYRSMGFPPQFFTVLFAVPRVTGYLAHWRESLTDPDVKIARPQQIYLVRRRDTRGHLGFCRLCEGLLSIGLVFRLDGRVAAQAFLYACVCGAVCSSCMHSSPCSD